MSKVRSLATLVLAILMTGALAGGATAQSAAPSATPAPIPQLTDTEWLVTQAFMGGSMVSVPAGVIATLYLSDGQATGSGGCNRFFGSYTASNPTAASGDLVFGPIGSSLMACPDPAGTAEAAYLAALATVASYVVDGNGLTLSDASGNAVLVYSYAGLPTVEGAWLVTGFNNGSAVTSPTLGSELTADFAPDGTVSGNAGCNHFSAAYTTDGAAITFGPILTTLMACPDAAVTAQETQYLAALAASTAWSQAPGTLTLTDATGATQVTFVTVEEASYIGSWDVTGVNNGQQALVTVAEDAGLTATFAPNGDIEGFAGCNSFFGTYTVVGSAITIGPLGTTRMACASDALNAQEQQYLIALQAAATWDIEAHGLTLRDAEGAMQVTFIAKPAAKIVAPTPTPTAKPTPSPTPKPTASPTPKPSASPTPKPSASATPKPSASATPKPTPSPTPKPTPSPTPKPTPTATPADTLNGTNWTLNKFTNGSGTDVPVSDVTTPPTLDFAAPAISGSGSCNNYSGTYSLSGASGIKLTVSTSTSKTCGDPETALEPAYLKALPNVTTWKINDSGNLVLTNSSSSSQLKLVYKTTTTP